MKQDALNDLQRVLSRADRSESDIRQRLASQGYEAHVIEEVIAVAHQKHWLDDKQLVARVIEKACLQGRGPLWVSHHVAAKGVSSDLIRSVLDGISDDQWVKSAMLCLHKYGHHDGQAQYHRLSRRGFPESIIALLRIEQYED